jgi:hypothetical protein
MSTVATAIWLLAIIGGFSLGILVSRAEAPVGPRPGGWGADPPEGTEHHRTFPGGMTAFHTLLGATALCVWVLWVAGDHTTYGLGRWWGLAGLVGAVAAGLAMAWPWYRSRQNVQFESREQRLAATGLLFHGFVGVLTVAAVIVAVIVT